MENSAPFDLNNAIEKWRENLLQSAAFRRENLDELESHLRDSISKLEQQNLSQEEAFVIATRRLGNPANLEGEFAKINTRAVWQDRILWFLIGSQVLSFVSYILNLLGWVALGAGTVNYNVRQTGMVLPVTLFSAVQTVLFAASLALSWWFIIRKGPTLAARFGGLLNRRSTLIALGAGLCLILVAPYLINILSSALWDRFSNVQNFHSAQIRSYSSMFMLPLRTVVLVAITLMLLRKRVKMKKV